MQETHTGSITSAAEFRNASYERRSRRNTVFQVSFDQIMSQKINGREAIKQKIKSNHFMTATFNHDISINRHPDGLPLAGEVRGRRPFLPTNYEKLKFATSEEILSAWAAFPMAARVKLLNLRFPTGPRVSLHALTQFQAYQGVRNRKTPIYPVQTARQLESSRKQLNERLPELLRVLKNDEIVLFLDEAVFTQRSILERTWRRRTALQTIPKQKQGFSAVAVVACIDIEGRLVGYQLSQKSIGLKELESLARLIRKQYGRCQVYLFLDNLALHHSKAFASIALKFKLKLIFNASYSSELNPIERLWALAKKRFGRELIADSDLSSQEEVEAFVIKSLITVPAHSLGQHVLSCIKLIVKRLLDYQFQTTGGMHANAEMSDVSQTAKQKSAGRSPSKDKSNQRNTNNGQAQVFQSGIFKSQEPAGHASKTKFSTNTVIADHFLANPVQQQLAESVEVDIKQLVDLTASKNYMYRGLAYYGQLFLPPKRQCSVEFLRQLLTGQKQYYLNVDVPVLHVQKLDQLTVKNVIEKVYAVPEVRAYLPDYDKQPEKKISREFLFAIVNKIDPTFFNRAIEDLEAQKKPAPGTEAKLSTLSIKPELMTILQKAQKSMKLKVAANDTRAFTQLLTTTKKRKRREIEEPQGLPTQLVIKRIKK